ncbi:hypothetical protein N8T08_000380 [Aspergillus melleus]|uniref:Uncharacterized protein n=1 Tax=Aspergillus melleus TaxID=138277 RepID=A0ACC3BBE0_9EURO|nr:hypothetical protein N8T08_000380 [Aspergillus melleus]
MHFLSALSIFALSAVVAADGGYSGSCRDPMPMYSGKPILDIECSGTDDNGDSFYERTMLDLNDCYAVVDDASIVPRKNGGMGGRCEMCNASWDGTLSCFCQDASGDRHLVDVDLNGAIRNVNGHLHCDVDDGGVDSECVGGWSDDIQCDDL